MDYAAILAPKDKEIPLKEIIKELKKYNWHVVSKEIEDYEEIPSCVLVWMLFNWKTLGYPSFSCKGYVRIVAGEQKDALRTYFHIVQSPWYCVIYYHILMWVELKRAKVKLFFKRWRNFGGYKS